MANFKTLQTGIWKRKWKIFRKAEAGSGEKGPSSTFVIHIERRKLKCDAIFWKIYDGKLFFDQPAWSKETFLKVCGSLNPGLSPTSINSKMNHAAYQLIFKSKSV